MRPGSTPRSVRARAAEPHHDLRTAQERDRPGGIEGRFRQQRGHDSDDTVPAWGPDVDGDADVRAGPAPGVEVLVRRGSGPVQRAPTSTNDAAPPGLLSCHQIANGATQRGEADSARHDHDVHTVVELVHSPRGPERTPDTDDGSRLPNGRGRRSPRPRRVPSAPWARRRPGRWRRRSRLPLAEGGQHVELSVPEPQGRAVHGLERERDHVSGLFAASHHPVGHGRRDAPALRGVVRPRQWAPTLPYRSSRRTRVACSRSRITALSLSRKGNPMLGSAANCGAQCAHCRRPRLPPRRWRGHRIRNGKAERPRRARRSAPAPASPPRSDHDWAHGPRSRRDRA